MERAVRNWSIAPEGRRSIWSAMRFLRYFTLVDIERVSGQPYDHCKKYVRSLELAGYLTLDHRANTKMPGDLNRYRLQLDTGPLAPIPRQKKVVWDPNQDKEIEILEGQNDYQRIWSWIQDHLQEPFSTHQIMQQTEIRLKTVQKYVGLLLKNNYLQRTEKFYLLISGKGQKAPAFDRQGNLREVESED